MNIVKVKRFSNLELSRMFNVECDGNTKHPRIHSIDEPFCFNDIQVPLWIERKLKKSKRVKHYDDQVKKGVTDHAPGTKERVEDLVKWYATHSDVEESAFEI